MQEFDNIKDMIYCEIDEISNQGKLDMNTVKVLGELVDILKDMGSIEMFEEGISIQEGDEYLFANGYGRNGGYSQRRMPVYYGDNGNSYRSGMRNSGYLRRGRSGYSRDDSKMHMVHKLEEMMNETQDMNDRDAIQRLINQLGEK